MSKMMESSAKHEELPSVSSVGLKNRASPGWDVYREKKELAKEWVTVVSSVRTRRQVKLEAVEVYYNHEMKKEKTWKPLNIDIRSFSHWIERQRQHS